MRIQRLFSFQWPFLSALIFLFFLAEAGGMGTAVASTGSAFFTIKPTYYPHYNGRPRPYFIYMSHPAGQIQDSLQVTNAGSVRGTVGLYAVDATTAQTSGPAFANPVGPQHDVGAWIKLSQRQVTLNPGQSQEVHFSLAIPEHVRPGQHGGAIIAKEPTQLQIQSSQSGLFDTSLQIHSEIDLGVLVNLPGLLVEKLSATGISYDTQNTYQRILIGLKNTGTQLLRPYGNLQIANAAGQQIQNEPLQMDTFLPQTSISYPVYIHHMALHPGTYSALILLNYGYNYKLSYRASFSINNPSFQKGSSFSRSTSDLLTLNPESSSTLTPIEYFIGIPILLLLISLLFYLSRKWYLSVINPRNNIRNKRGSPR